MKQTGDNPSFQVDPEAAASIHEDGIVILHLTRGRVYSCNGTGARIWRGVEQELPLNEIADQVMGEFRIAGATAHEHTVQFLGELERHSLIRRRAA